MAATAAAILPSREDPRAALRIAQNAERRARQARTQTSRTFGNLPVLNASLGQSAELPVAANNDAQFRAAQHRERLRRQVGATVPLYIEPAASDEYLEDAEEENYQQAMQSVYADSQTGLDNRAASAIRGELNALGDKAVDQALRAVRTKAKETAQRWMISLFKNGVAITEIPPWAAWIVEVLTYLYDCARAVVTILVPEPVIDFTRDTTTVVVDITKKGIRTVIPPFSLTEPVGLLGFIFQSLIVVALITIQILIIAVIVLVIMSAYDLISLASFGAI